MEIYRTGIDSIDIAFIEFVKSVIAFILQIHPRKNYKVKVTRMPMKAKVYLVCLLKLFVTKVLFYNIKLLKMQQARLKRLAPIFGSLLYGYEYKYRNCLQ